jgi:hypothetical protein
MPWKASKPMDERLKFVARVLDGEKMAPLCASSPSRARPTTRSSGATTTAAIIRNPCLPWGPPETGAAGGIEPPTHALRMREKRLTKAVFAYFLDSLVAPCRGLRLPAIGVHK